MDWEKNRRKGLTQERVSAMITLLCWLTVIATVSLMMTACVMRSEGGGEDTSRAAEFRYVTKNLMEGTEYVSPITVIQYTKTGHCWVQYGSGLAEAGESVCYWAFRGERLPQP